MQPIQMIDLAAQQQLIRKQLDLAIAKVLDHNDYILGSKVVELETTLAEFCGSKYAISCANGTDALVLVLMAQQLRPTDAIFVPAFTFTATVEAVVLAGATPVFVDVLEDTFNMDPQSLATAIKIAKTNGLVPTGIITVDLFGTPAEYLELEAISKQHHLWLLDDAAQSFGGSYFNKKIGNFGLATTTSFFPAKPLGCYGDGGAIFTNDLKLADTIRSIRNHGAKVENGIADRYNTIRIGMNSRLDTIQAVILLEKLKIFPEELKLRQAIAENYHKLLVTYPQLKLPKISNNIISSWAQYTIKLNSNELDLKHFNNRTMQNALQQAGISSVIYYPKAISSTLPYCKYPKAPVKVAEYLPNIVLSLPMHPYITLEQQNYIATTISQILSQQTIKQPHEQFAIVI